MKKKGLDFHSGMRLFMRVVVPQHLLFFQTALWCRGPGCFPSHSLPSAEVGGMEVVNGSKIHLTSAAAFVEGGSQDALDDACSICLEAFRESDPSTVTSCKHEFHLQCVLEWCQRSSNCPMCWQAISLKDPSSQELLETVERERIQQAKPLPVGVDAAELEDRMMQHLAAAATVGRTRRLALARSEGRRSNSSVQTNPQLMVPTDPVSNSVNEPASSVNNHSRPVTRSVYVNQTISRIRVSEVSSTTNSDSGGSSELQSISKKWKSRFNSMSMKYKESISKSTREWKEKLFSRSSTMSRVDGIHGNKGKQQQPGN